MVRDNRRRGGGGRGRGSRDDNGSGGRRRSHSRRGGPRRSHPRQSAESGNKRERIAVESGSLVLIDQFMLANPQFAERLKEIIDSEDSVKEALIRDYGGLIVNLEPGTYKIERDPFAYQIIVHPEGDRPESEGLSESATVEHGHVLVDTRCLAMIDRELLDDSSLLEKYQQLWFSGQDKACRDLIRDNGGAVRYGFNRHGDELSVFQIPDSNIVCLWPDIVEAPVAEAATTEVASEAEATV